MQILIFNKRLYRHLLFWAGVLLFFCIIEFLGGGIFKQEAIYIKLYWINFFFESLPTYLFFTYLLLYKVVPVFLQKRYWQSLLAFAGLFLLTVFLQNIFSELDLYLIQPGLSGVSASIPFTFSTLANDLGNVKDWVTLGYDFVLVGFVAAAIKIFNAWLTVKRASVYLEQEKLRTELQLIKTQVNPDFLFNALNDLHTLTLQQSDHSPQVVLKLAALLSYLLYESQADEVLLEKEIEMIHNYMYLMKIHLQDTFDLSENISGDMAGKKIAPLLLLPFLEYIFKKEACVEQAWASIDLTITNDGIKLIIVKGTNKASEVSFDQVKKRLDNLYADRYELKLIPEEDTLLIKLSVNLSATDSQTLNPIL